MLTWLMQPSILLRFVARALPVPWIHHHSPDEATGYNGLRTETEKFARPLAVQTSHGL